MEKKILYRDVNGNLKTNRIFFLVGIGCITTLLPTSQMFSNISRKYYGKQIFVFTNFILQIFCWNMLIKGQLVITSLKKWKSYISGYWKKYNVRIFYIFKNFFLYKYSLHYKCNNLSKLIIFLNHCHARAQHKHTSTYNGIQRWHTAPVQSLIRYSWSLHWVCGTTPKYQNTPGGSDFSLFLPGVCEDRHPPYQPGKTTTSVIIFTF